MPVVFPGYPATLTPAASWPWCAGACRRHQSSAGHRSPTSAMPSPHWPGCLKPENRRLVPANSFSEQRPLPDDALRIVARGAEGELRPSSESCRRSTLPIPKSCPQESWDRYAVQLGKRAASPINFLKAEHFRRSRSRSPSAARARRCSAISSAEADFRWWKRASSSTSSNARRNVAIVDGS